MVEIPVRLEEKVKTFCAISRMVAFLKDYIVFAEKDKESPVGFPAVEVLLQMQRGRRDEGGLKLQNIFKVGLSSLNLGKQDGNEEA